MPKLTIISFSMSCNTYMCNEKEENPSGNIKKKTQCHIWFNFAVFYQLKIWVFSPTGTSESGHKNFMQTSRGAVKKKFNMCFNCTQLCCWFLLVLWQKMQTFWVIFFSFVSPLFTAIFTSKKKWGLISYQLQGKKKQIWYSLTLKGDEGMGRNDEKSWSISFSSFFSASE